MTIDPAVLIGAIAGLAGLIGYTVRLFLTGQVLPRNAVPREDYEALKAINASLVASIPLLTEAVHKALATTQVVIKNGSA